MDAHRNRCMRLMLILLTLPALLVAYACAFATAKPRIVKGMDFPQDKVAQVEKGISSEQLSALLGRPFAIEVTEGGRSRWRYYERERQDEKIYILGFIPLRRPYWVVESEFVVLIEDGVVREVSFREQRLK